MDVILVAGPTASGKSALALTLAVREARAGRAATIVNADSMQVYGVLRTLTARPSEADEALAPHALYGHVDPRHAYSVAQWLEDVRRVLARCREEGRTPIVTGGTGLYYRALLEGLSGVPPIDSEVRATVREALSREGAPQLHAALATIDPRGAAALRPSDGQRVARALEVMRSTGRPLREWQGSGRGILDAERCERHLVMPERPVLHARIERRARLMLEGGVKSEAALEVAALLALDLPPDAPAGKALGVAALSGLLAGRIDVNEAERRLVVETRRYAKRQCTWFRNQLGSGWRVSESAEAAFISNE